MKAAFEGVRMEPMDYWRLCDELAIVRAALLIAGVEPTRYEDNKPNLSSIDGYTPISAAIATALYNGEIKGEARAFNRMLLSEAAISGFEIVPNSGDVDPYESIVNVESLKEWLRSKGVTSGFFFPDSSPTPDYLNKDHLCYSPKLAAAIEAWIAVQADPRYQKNGKTVRANLEAWIDANASLFDLVNESGDKMASTIKDLSKVANWDTRGGAPKTPERNPPRQQENLLTGSETTETVGSSDGFDDASF